MNSLYPIYTGVTDCQDCYKCVRHCPVKAIHIKDGKASVIPEDCILCGKCVLICPSGAKRIRDDLERAKQLIRIKDRVIVSLAPSYVNEFENVKKEQLIAAIKSLGFWGVSETALGAQEVSAHVADVLSKANKGVFLSSACPSAVELVRKHYPRFHDSVTTLKSPMQAHATRLIKEYGKNTTIVFVGPCIAKKDEADLHPDLVSVSITFQDLARWFEQEKIDLKNMQYNDTDKFIPEEAREGSLYPVEGGMIAGIKAECTVNDPAFMSFSGVGDIQMALKGLEDFNPPRPVFIELLACKGGCINGPAKLNDKSTVLKRFTILEESTYSQKEYPRQPLENIQENYPKVNKIETLICEEDLIKTLHRIGKYTKEDELNCGGCGYFSCRDFAYALFEGKAEPEMCVTRMRKLAYKKANALLKAIPSGVVIVNEQLKIVECNRKFSKLLGEVEEKIFEAKPGMEGARLDKILPFSHYFQSVLETGKDMLEKDFLIDKQILHGSIFTIEKNRIVGGVFQDITTPAMQREQIIDKTKEVIEKNLETVQKIAYLLGENASETQVVLDSIIHSFSAGLSDKEKNGTR
jgi:iron only hydrogenase large subunit-like protein